MHAHTSYRKTGDVYGGDDPPITSDPRIEKLLRSAIDAAVSTGAMYADVRFTHTIDRRFQPITAANVEGSVTDSETIEIGVRALVAGYWGFASGPVWTSNECVRLGKEAVLQAIANRFKNDREMSLAPVSVVKNGSWTTPVQIDPFTLHPSQIFDIVRGLVFFALNHPGVQRVFASAQFTRQDKAFATSDGSYLTQRTYRSAGTFQIDHRYNGVEGGGSMDFLSPAGVGFEHFDETRIREAVPPLIEDIKWNASLPAIPLDVGRYETVFDAASSAGLVSPTLGAATELDRALGFEANAGGTSYLNDPAAMLGTNVASSSISVTADRSEVGGAATVKWDDEGAVPVTTSLIKNGILSGYQTTREGAGWLADAKLPTVPGSTGAAYSPNGTLAPLAHTSNLRLHAGPDDLDFNSLVQTVKSGIGIKDATPSLDFQLLNGVVNGRCYQIINGKITARLGGAAILFRSPELWKGIRAIGGEQARRTYGLSMKKGQPSQTSYHTVDAVPIHHEGLTYIDPMRKA